MKQYLLTIILLLTSLMASAAPALRTRRLVRLTDGRELMVTSHGDEHLSYYLTDRGEVVLNESDSFHGTGMTLDEYLASLPAARRNVLQRVGSVKTALIQPFGSKKIPVILAAFDDLKFSVALSEKRVNEYYNRVFNGSETEYHYTGTDNLGSVRDYFTDNSRDLFKPEFTIIGPITTDKGYAYYGEDQNGTNDIRYNEFLREIFSKAKSAEEDWTQFDSNDDGKVDLCIVVYAGLGQNYADIYHGKDYIWPKEMPVSFSVDGVSLAGCCSVSEQRPTAAKDGYITASQPDGIGVIVHEMSHALGLPDFYDRNNVAFGMDFWSVMDYGEYTNQSHIPVGYTAYEREFLGWQETETLTGPCTIQLKSFAEGGKGYKLVNEANPYEYYILDNRQATGWDQGLCRKRGHGMLVTHVDYNERAWNTNVVNSDKLHQRMTIIPANSMFFGNNNSSGSTSLWSESLQGNPYPGLTGNHELADESLPASVVFTGGYMSKPLYDIEETEDGVITVKVMPLGRLDAPTYPMQLDIDTWVSKCHLTWNEVDNADMYNLRLYLENELIAERDSIAGCVFSFVPEKAGNYRFEVQAINDKYRNSEWAVSENFWTSPDAITDISESTKLVRVYDIRGRMVTECYADELHRLSMTGGIYLIRYPNNKVKKVLIR